MCRTTANHYENQGSQTQHRRNPSQAQDAQNGCAVLSRLWIVVIAIEQQLIDQVADLALPRLNQAEPQIFRWIFDAVVVLRDLAFGGQHHDRGRVRELLGLFVILVLKSRGLGQRINGVLLPHQKMPALLGARAFVPFGKPAFFFAAISGVSLGSKLTVMTSNSLPTSNFIMRSECSKP